jgi:hypothetical protein
MSGTTMEDNKMSSLIHVEQNKQISMFNSDDGWADAANDYADNVLRGELIKCVDGHWSFGRDGTPLKADTRLVALGTVAAWVKWEEGKPTQYRVRKPGEQLLDRAELGDTDETRWETGPDDNPRDPWQSTRFVHFVDPATAAALTFSTSSWSGRNAVIALGDQITRMRVARPGASPVVEFTSAPLQTKFGRKMKPVLKVVGWVGGSDEPKPLDQLPKGGDMDDTIPF